MNVEIRRVCLELSRDADFSSIVMERNSIRYWRAITRRLWTVPRIREASCNAKAAIQFNVFGHKLNACEGLRWCRRLHVLHFWKYIWVQAARYLYLRNPTWTLTIYILSILEVRVKYEDQFFFTERLENRRGLLLDVHTKHCFAYHEKDRWCMVNVTGARKAAFAYCNVDKLRHCNR